MEINENTKWVKCIRKDLPYENFTIAKKYKVYLHISNSLMSNKLKLRDDSGYLDIVKEYNFIETDKPIDIDFEITPDNIKEVLIYNNIDPSTYKIHDNYIHFFYKKFYNNHKYEYDNKFHFGNSNWLKLVEACVGKLKPLKE